MAFLVVMPAKLRRFLKAEGIHVVRLLITVFVYDDHIADAQ